MNGRCDNDPLDPADNVCDLCGGEFCDVCLITPRGRKKPWCKKCALDHSGVRGGVKTQKKSGKREARRRREEIVESRSEHADGKFIFFDDDDSDFELREPIPAAAEPETKKVNRRKVSLGILKNKNEEEEEEAQAAEPVLNDAPPPAVGDEIEQMVVAPPPTAADAIVEEPTSIELLARLQDHVPAGMLDDAAIEPAAFNFNTSPSTATMPALDDAFDPNFDPFAMPGTSQAPSETAGYEAPAPPAATDALTNFDADRFLDDLEEEEEEEEVLDGEPIVAQSFEPVPPSIQRPSLVDRLTEDAPVVPPAESAVGPVSEAQFLNEADIDDSGDHLGDDEMDEDWTSDEPEDEGALTPVPDRRSDEVEFEPSGGDDTDDTGNWIPPALRGMAPVEEREAMALPKRGRN